MNLERLVTTVVQSKVGHPMVDSSMADYLMYGARARHERSGGLLTGYPNQV